MAMSSMIDWDRAEQVAVRVAERQPAPSAAAPEWDPPTERIEQQIEDVTGLRSAAGTATAEVIDRAAWVRANIASFRGMLDPVLTKLEAARPTTGTGAA